MEPAQNNLLISRQMETQESNRDMHEHGGLYYYVLEAIERYCHGGMQKSAETGCGRSTILFSNLSEHHTVFCLDDRGNSDASSVLYYQNSDLFKKEHVEEVFGPTQQTLPAYDHNTLYDCVLIDGPHGYPFPDMEYFHFYPHIKKGGLLIIDDVHIASIGRMADIIQEDAMWHLEEVVKTTAIFRRSEAETFSPTGDGWWQQGYNQRRTYRKKPFHIDDGFPYMSFYERYFSHVKMPNRNKKKHFLTRFLG